MEVSLSASTSAIDSPFVDPDAVAEDQDAQQYERDFTDQQDASSDNLNQELSEQPFLEDIVETRPRAPLLRPIPALSSTVSSLSGSRGIALSGNMAQSTPILSTNNGEGSSRDMESNSMAFNHNLIQMLSLVGNRYLEAEGKGMLPLDEEAFTSPHRSLNLTTTGSPSPKGKRREMFRSLMDDELTPKGGRSPMTSSLANIGTTARAPASQRLVSHIAEVSSGSDSQSEPRELPGSRNQSQSSSAVASSTESSQSDVSATGMQMSIHALSTAVEPAEDHKDQLKERLKNVFDLEEEEEVVSCHPCWLFRGILLQGYMYVLTSHVCFYAYMPSREDRVLKAGTLHKKTRRTHRFSRHWAVLRGRSLSWYESNRDPYFPQDNIDLRNILEVTMAEDGRFNVETPYRSFLFEAESLASAQDWVNVLKRSVFRAQNEGESVRISIPLEAILDVDGSDTSSLKTDWSGEGQDMVSIKVVDAIESRNDYSMDEYFFLNLANPSGFVEDLRARLIEYAQVPSRPRPIVRDSTSSLTTLTARPITIPIKQPKDINVFAASGLESQLADATLSNTPRDLEMSIERDEQYPLSSSLRTLKSLSSSVHSYPPSPSRTPSSSLHPVERKPKLPQWVREASSKVNLGNTENWLPFAKKLPGRSIRENWSNPPLSSYDTDLGIGEESLEDSSSSLFSVLESPEREGQIKEADIHQQFRQCFSLPDSEKLLGHLNVSLYRVLPVSGRLYVSTNYVCFRSSKLASKTMGRTLMMLPKKEIISVAKNNAFRYGQYGLVIIVRGHEEIFLEFASTLRRDQCISLLDFSAKAEESIEKEDDRNEALLLTDLGQRLHLSDSASDIPEPSPKLFNSASSTFLASKPKDQLHITFLTIGSRGDVQPYIAFAKGLRQEGHTVRIATHGEFQAWIESYGIEFREVGGDPAELMRICVDNGTFTVAFLRESMTKFRGWLDDLLVSCWQACQGTDVVVESPSAIAGIHVAEALQVPYYRAFTMPWTRTRVYPHAFAVPGHKAGGNYNYMSYVIFDQVFWRASAGQINSWRRKCLNLKPTSLDKLEQHKVPFLYNFSPNLVPKPIDWYDWIHVTGFWFLDRADENGAKDWEPPDDLVDFIAKAKSNDRKLVYIGWGSIVVADAQAMTRIVVDAVKKSGVCAILSKGWSDRLQHDCVNLHEEEEDHPDIYNVQSIPHDWLFPQLDAACHHGGSGTLGASLRAGIPTIVKPYFGDQFFWASQVESLNVGSFVRNFTVDEFSKALKHCTTDVKIIENAKKLGEVIRAEDGVGKAIQAFYGDWEYACSRIPRGGKLTATFVAAEKEVVEGQRSIDHDVISEANTTTDSTMVSIESGDQVDNSIAGEDGDDEMDGWSVVSGSEEDLPRA